MDDLSITGNPGSSLTAPEGDEGWTASVSDLVAVSMDYGPATKAELTITAVGFDDEYVAASAELTLDDLVTLRDWLDARIVDVRRGY